MSSKLRAPGRSNGRRVPRWVRWFAVAAIAVGVLLGVLLGLGHGPGQHGTASGPTVGSVQQDQ